ncbi:MAG: hypothetical protein JXK07_07455 [Spirochaetes bacterium]|nr:hypothetical protein [Spirochaetota bacterium]MBN2769690.1 hypothetical protein [Spirochaetota bacterium]
MKTFSKTLIKFLVIGTVALFTGCSVCNQSGGDGKVKVACLGASNTRGYQIGDTSKNAFPGQIQALAGEKWDVRNFGVGGTCVLRDVGMSYWNTLDLYQAIEFEPDIVVLDFCWNDLKPENWKLLPDHFVDDYTVLIKTFQELPSKPRIIMLYPPVFRDEAGFTDSAWNRIKPLLDQVAQKNDIETIDLFSTHAHIREYYNWDSVHFSIEGCKSVAKVIYDYIQTKTVSQNI